MPFITFIYKIGNKNRTYYVKYVCDYLSDDHLGLDREVRHVLKKNINKYRKMKNFPEIKQKIKIGIISYSNDRYIPVYSSSSEIKCFDFYYTYEKYVEKIYINGKLLGDPNNS